MGEEIDCILCHQSDDVIKFTNLIGQTQIRMFILFVHGLSILQKFSNTTQCEILL